MTRFINPRGKVLQHLNTLFALKVNKSVSPISAEIDLSNRCNLKCDWCAFANTHNGEVMDLRTAFDLTHPDEHDYPGHSVKSITWSGGGEPTLNPDFDAIIKLCNLPQGLYTNGTNITPERARLLKERMTWVFVSLDCLDMETYYREKGARLWEQTLFGIRKMASLPGNATIGVGFLLHAGNYHQVRGMHDLGMSLGADYVHFRPAVKWNKDKPNELGEDTTWLHDRALWDAFEDLGVDGDRFALYRDWQGHGYETCYWAALSTVYTPDGKRWTCCNRRGIDCNEWGTPVKVDEQCRVMCRGHMANLTLNEIMQDAPHKEFI